MKAQSTKSHRTRTFGRQPPGGRRSVPRPGHRSGPRQPVQAQFGDGFRPSGVLRCRRDELEYPRPPDTDTATSDHSCRALAEGRRTPSHGVPLRVTDPVGQAPRRVDAEDITARYGRKSWRSASRCPQQSGKAAGSRSRTQASRNHTRQRNQPRNPRLRRRCPRALIPSTPHRSRPPLIGFASRRIRPAPRDQVRRSRG